MTRLSKPLKAFFGANAIFVLAEVLIAPLYALYAEDVGATLLIVSYLAATVFVSKTISLLIISKFGNSTFTAEQLLHLGFILRGIGWGLLIFFPIIPVLFITQILTGVGQATGSPGFLALYAKYVDEENGVQISAGWSLTEGFVAAVGTIIGGHIVMQFGFTALFILMTVLSFLASFTFWHYSTNQDS